MNKMLKIFIACIALILISGIVLVEKLPGRSPEDFSKDLVDPGISSFQELYKGTVVAVLETTIEQSSRFSGITQTLEVELQSGPDKGQRVQAEYDERLTDAKTQEIKIGDKLVLGKIETPEETSYVVTDRYRLPAIAFFAILFAVLAMVFGRRHGALSLVGLCISLLVLIWFITPHLLAGKNPFLVTLVGAGSIALVSMFLAHGLKPRTMLAVTSTIITLSLSQVLAYFFTLSATLLGDGSSDALYLQTGLFSNLNLQGLFLGGIVIGTLGVLDDITTAQAATVEEIHSANPELSLKQLYAKGSSVGKEHIASLINTLVLAYVGSSLPLFLLFTTAANSQVWAIINSAPLAEEIVRTLVGSTALILAVPITTLLSAYYFSRQK